MYEKCLIFRYVHPNVSKLVIENAAGYDQNSKHTYI